MKNFLEQIENKMNEEMKIISESISVGNNEKKKASEEVLKTLKLIKAALTKANTTKDYSLTEEEEINTLIEMVEQRKGSIVEYKNAKREDLVTIEQGEINLIYEIAPEVKEYFDSLPTTEDIENFAKECVESYIAEKGSDYKLSMRDMGAIMKGVKGKYPKCDGLIIKNVFQTYL